MNHSNEEQDQRREAIRIDIARRLRKACSYLDDDEFAQLVEGMVKMQLRSERGPGKTPS